MSSNIIPMLPSTPPPLDESVESDDDELGNFTTVLGKYDDSLTEAPRSTCDEPQIKSDKNNCTNHYVQSRNDINIQKTEIHLGNSYKHFGDFPDKSVVKDKGSDDDKKSSRKSSLENKNGKVERIASEMQEKLQMDDGRRYSPTANDTESQSDSPLKINKENIKDDSGCLSENSQQALVASSVEALVASSVEGYVDLSDNEISEIQDSNRTAVHYVKEDKDASTVYATLAVTEVDINDSAVLDTEEMTENKRIHIPSQQYRKNADSEDPSTFVLPLVPKPNETVSFQQRSNSLEPSPISLSENFTSASDVSSEFSNFETAKSSPNSTDTCDKQEVIERSENNSNGIQDRKESEYDIGCKDSVDENSCTSVSPLVFQETIPTEINSEADDDDFADFQQANDENYFSSMTVIKDEDDECHLYDLNEEGISVKPSIDYEDSTSFTQATSDNDDFADFESAHQNATMSHTEDDFANFEHASFEVEMPKDESENQIALTEISEKGKGKVTQLVYASFPTIYEEKTPETDEVFPFRNETDYTSMLLRGRSKRLWDRLQDLDTTPAMLFRWGSSQCFQAMLHSLNIDSHSILRNPSVPIYASSLGLLEPTKGPHSPKHLTTVNKHISFQEVVPPAQFDWSDSGLINPLDTSQASGLFDLDFFTAQNSVSSITDVVGSELEAELFGPSTVCVGSGDKDNKSPLITQILASSKSTIFPSAQRQCSRPAGLSEEVVRVLDKLPDLSFMQAKVLMFPIHSLSDH